jgi:hypothetical protein
MAHISFALFAAHEGGATYDELAVKLNLPIDWVRERIESARLCLEVPMFSDRD